MTKYSSVACSTQTWLQYMNKKYLNTEKNSQKE